MRKTYRTKGFTLFEVALGISLTAILLAVTLPWVVSLMTSTSHNLDSEQTRRQLDTAVEKMAADVRQAQNCGTSTSAIYEASKDHVAWFVRDGEIWGDNPVMGTLVQWQVTSEGLVRTETPTLVECVTSEAGPIYPLGIPEAQIEQLFPGHFQVPALVSTTRVNLLDTSAAQAAGKPKAVIALDITNPATKAVYSAREIVPTP